jgi:hypothetical protein
VWIGAERIRIVVEKSVLGRTRENHRVRCSGTLQRMIVPPAHLLDMPPVKISEFTVLVAEVQAHCPNHTGSHLTVRV